MNASKEFKTENANNADIRPSKLKSYYFKGKIDVLMLFAKFEFDRLENYIDVMESALQQKRQEFEEAVEKEAAELEPRSRDEYYENYADDYRELVDEFPNLLRSSLFVSIYSTIEHQLIGYCRQLREINGYKKEPKFSAHVLKNIYSYLVETAKIEHLQSSENWEELTEYNDVRNAIVHDGGVVDNKRPERQEKVLAFVASHQLIKIGHLNRIQLEQGFCTNFIQIARKLFFEDLFDEHK